VGFGSGIFEKRVLASSKLTSAEKYHFTYMSDLALIKEYIQGVTIEDDGSGKVRVRYSGGEFEATVRDYVKQEKAEDNGTEQPAAPPEPPKPRRYVALFDVKNYDR
jgi:hypothetical protein